MPYVRPEPFKVAAAQLSPVFLDRDATIERACDAIAEAARGGARLVVFSEGFVPGYPLWVWTVPAGQSMPLRALYASPLKDLILAVAWAHGLYGRSVTWRGNRLRVLPGTRLAALPAVASARAAA